MFSKWVSKPIGQITGKGTLEKVFMLLESTKYTSTMPPP
jgi:hypothetical protein